MKRILLLLIITGFVHSDSAIAKPLRKRPGLLTESYGIVTKSDLDEEERKATPEPFPPKLPSFNYWQCLKSEGYFLGCENEGLAAGEDWEIGSATFWIKANGKTYDFGTRRNWDIGFCESMITKILRIIKYEPIVCVSASYLGGDAKGSRWVVERVKTKKGEWSWFGRQP